MVQLIIKQSKIFIWFSTVIAVFFSALTLSWALSCVMPEDEVAYFNLETESSASGRVDASDMGITMEVASLKDGFTVIIRDKDGNILQETTRYREIR